MPVTRYRSVSTCQVCSALSVSRDPDKALGERKSWEAMLESLHSQRSFRNHRLDHGVLSTGIEPEDPVRRTSGRPRDGLVEKGIVSPFLSNCGSVPHSLSAVWPGRSGKRNDHDIFAIDKNPEKTILYHTD
jgi:hypothetical protein